MNGVKPGRVLALLLAGAALFAQTTDIDRRLDAARALKARGAARQALEAYEAALPEIRASGSHDLLSRVLIETAQTAIATGDYRRGVANAEEAAATANAAHDAKREGLAQNLIGQAQLYQGAYAPALTAFQRAFELAESQHDVDAACIRLGNIGNVHFFQGRYLDALQSYQLALLKAESTSGAASNGRQLALANLAILYEQLGQNEKALGYYQRAQASAAALQPSEYAQLLSNMGTLYRRMGDPVKALATYDAARQLFRRATHSDGEIHVLHNTGLVLALDYKAPDHALAAFTEALQLADKTANRRQAMLGRLYRGEALLRLHRVADARAEYRKAFETATELGAAEEQWTAEYGIGQSEDAAGHKDAAAAAYRDAIRIVESLRGGLGASTLKSEFLGNKRSVYDAYIASLLDRDRADPEQLFALFENLRSRNLQDTLRRKLERPTIASLQRRLDSRSMLVEYWIGADRGAALWITDRASGLVPLRLKPDDLAKMRRLSDAFAAGEAPTWRSDAADLAPVLFGGLPLDAGRPNLIVVPDGVLCSLPFDVLPAKNGRRLVDDFAVSSLPAAALLLRGDAAPRRVLPWKRQLVAFGDPLLGDGDELSPPGGWGRLPGAGVEARYAARELPGRAVTDLGADDLKRYLTAGAAAGVPVLHFSTHAAVDLLDPNRSRILFTAEKGSPGSKYLFWQEVQGLPLAGVDLVTLAACETEGGKFVPGEGIQSFSRAFLAAGARSTVTALWRVADRPTAELMRVFYRELGRGVPKAEALRRAKLDLARSSSPQYWAAFVFTGDGREILPVAGWSIVLGPLAVLLVVSALIFVYRRRS
jgi:tetratricopeptide (TPR) repeat protein